jgi:transcriptional regulator with XRE-family HTH domain
MELLMKIMERIERLRAEKGLSQRAIADAAGLSKPGMQSMLARKDMKLSNLVKIAQILEVDVLQLLTDTHTPDQRDVLIGYLESELEKLRNS